MSYGIWKGSGLFRRNVGGIDRALRLIAGTVILATGLFVWNQGSRHGLDIAIVGLIILAAAAAGICPLYIPFGISTARKVSRYQSSVDNAVAATRSRG